MGNYEDVGVAEGWLETKSKKKQLKAWQNLVDTGMAWKLQGSTGRMAHDLLQQGLIKFPKKRTYDFYGNAIPTRAEVKKRGGVKTN